MKWSLNWLNTIFGNINLSSSKTNLHAEITIAILPFKNNTHKEETTYFSDGMAEEIINSLAAIPGLKVVSRNSSKGFKKFQDLHEIVQSTALGKVIQGNFYKIDNKLRLNVELIEFKNSSTIWSKNYYEPIVETRNIIDDIVVNTIKKLSVDSSENLDIYNGIKKNPKFHAYDLFLKGRWKSVV